MEIQSFDKYSGLYSNYQYKSIPAVDTETVKKQDAKKNIEVNDSLETLKNDYASVQRTVDTRSKSANLQDVSLSLKIDDFDFVGKDSFIESLDLQKMVSDVKKDQVLDEYNYFVGSAKGSSPVYNGNDDGMVFQKIMGFE